MHAVKLTDLLISHMPMPMQNLNVVTWLQTSQAAQTQTLKILRIVAYMYANMLAGDCAVLL